MLLETQPPPELIEMRRARDGHWYSRYEFIDHYGEDADDRWDEAEVTSATEPGDEIPRDLHSIIGNAVWPREMPMVVLYGGNAFLFLYKKVDQANAAAVRLFNLGGVNPPQQPPDSAQRGSTPPQQHRHQNRSTIYAVIQYNTSTSPTSSSCKEKAQGSRPPKNTAATTFQHVDWLTGPYCSSTFRPWWGVLTRSGVITPYGRVDVGR